MPKTGLHVQRRYTRPGDDPLDTVQWQKVPVKLTAPDGRIVYEHPAFEAPTSWSATAVSILASKYAAKTGVPQDGSVGGEWSLKQVVGRIVEAITGAGSRLDYFATPGDESAFRDELTWLLVHQRFAFNSPVWFNAGRYETYGHQASGGNWAWDHERGEAFQVRNSYERPQLSACFIQGVEDSIDGPGGMMDLLRSEARLFKHGSGTGTNFSHVRGKGEAIRGGGLSSGLMSFLDVFDANAGSIKSGGTTRRAAKMVILDADHPEILEFIGWKAREEQKAQALLAAGIGLDAQGRADYEGDAYRTVGGQNSNNSVMLPDAFLQAVQDDQNWSLTARQGGNTVEHVKARKLWDALCQAAWACGDPGVMFFDTIQRWHTCKADGAIRASNPCGEYLAVDGTSCNLGSLNLATFHRGGAFDVESFRHAIRIAVIALDIVVSHASYPTKQICEATLRYRNIGLGYANVGTLLMLRGLPYDSKEARAYMAAVTSLMAAQAYQTSAELAQFLGTFPGFEANRCHMVEVLRLHEDAALRLAAGSRTGDAGAIAEAASVAWGNVIEHAATGVRNSQVVVVAPTGTIALLMDCSTTGIEPAFSLRAHKRLAGGGSLTLPIPELDKALQALGYNAAEAKAILDHVDGAGSIQGAPHIQDKHLAVFACAVDPRGNTLPWRAHLEMVAAVQPYVSGSISKTINLPHDATVQDVGEAYLAAWRLGVKNVAVYRNGCKQSQPLTTQNLDAAKPELGENQIREALKRYPHLAWGHKEAVPAKADHAENLFYTVGGINVHITLTFRRTDAGFRLNQVFLNVGEQGDHIFEHARDLAIAWSRQLRLGEKPQSIARKCITAHGRGGGLTDHPLIKTCTSLKDVVWKIIMLEVYGQTDFVHPELLSTYLGSLDREEFIHERLAHDKAPVRRERRITEYLDQAPGPLTDAKCPDCGATGDALQVTGTCHTCGACGHSFGGC